MRFVAAVAVLGLAQAAVIDKRQVAREENIELTEVEKLCFATDLDDFMDEGHAWNRNETYEWHTDGCTAAPNMPLGFDFEPSCWRHDFCYHTLAKVSGQFCPGVKEIVDTIFREDLFNVCRAEQDQAKKDDCIELAQAYHSGVATFGKLETPYSVDANGNAKQCFVSKRGKILNDDPANVPERRLTAWESVKKNLSPSETWQGWMNNKASRGLNLLVWHSLFQPTPKRREKPIDQKNEPFPDVMVN